MPPLPGMRWPRLLCFSWRPTEIAANGADLAEDMLASIQNALLRYPTSFAQWLSAADFAVGPTVKSRCVGDLDDAGTETLLKTSMEKLPARQVTAISAYPPDSGSPVLLTDRPFIMTDRPPMSARALFVCNLSTHLMKWKFNWREIQ